jgi:Skp family chaperone for outer membrane proteins
MLKYLRYALVLSIALPAAVSAQAPEPAAPGASPLAYFSPQRAFYASADGQAAQARLSSIQAEASRQLDAQNARLKALQNALAEGSSLLNDQARRQREQEIEKFQIDLERFVEDAQAEFLGVQRELETAFLAKLRPALDSVARDRGLLLVFNEDAGVVAWGDPALDITPDVIRRVNQP